MEEEEYDKPQVGRPRAHDKMINMPIRVRESVKDEYDIMSKEVKANILTHVRASFEVIVQRNKKKRT